MCNKKTLLILGAVLLGAVSILNVRAEESPVTDSTLNPRFAAIQEKYRGRFADLKRRGDEISDDAPQGAENGLGFDLDFSKTTRQEVSFDVPDFEMRLQRIVFDVPQVTMKLQTISWDQPETRMEARKVGQYPEFHGLTVRWSDLITHVPVVEMKRHEAKLHLPETRMAPMEVKLHLPECTGTHRVRWVFDLPTVKARTTESAKRETEGAAEGLRNDAQALAAAMTAEMQTAAREELLAKRDALKLQGEAAVSACEAAIQQARAAGSDPTQIRLSDGGNLDLVANRDTVRRSFAEALEKLESVLAGSLSAS